MSKGLGQKIGIKFTEDLIGLELNPIRYKYFKWEIDTRWSSYIYIYGIELKTDGDYFLPTGIVTVSNQYSATYSGDKAFDGSTSTYWRTNNIPAWIQIELTEPILLTGFRWNTQTSSYRPRDFNLLGSNDGENWDKIYEAESPAVSNWKPFEWIPALKSGNENAFTVSAKEYKYVNGPLIPKEYEMTTVERHPTEQKSILITVDWWQRFRNTEGNLKVNYDDTKGNLAGTGGGVESFEIEFAPEDLIQEPNPGLEENLKAYPYEIILGFKEIEYADKFHIENLKAYPYSISLDLKNVDEINP